MTKLPDGFVYLSDIDPSIKQEIYYASDFNFVGRKIDGYKKPVAILTLKAAEALRDAQKYFHKDGYCIKVIDAYRPHRAVQDFWRWAEDVKDTKMKKIFYPLYDDKTRLFEDGYLAKYSSHSRGSTVDLTLLYLNGMEVDMGSQIDMLDSVSNTETNLITAKQLMNRLYLKRVMEKFGFDGYSKEWWHFQLSDEPFKRKPEDHFDFVVE